MTVNTNLVVEYIETLENAQRMYFHHGETMDYPYIEKTHNNEFMVSYYINGGLSQYTTTVASDAYNEAVKQAGTGPLNISIGTQNPPSSLRLVSEIKYKIVPTCM